MSCACLLACTHADSQTLIEPSLIHRIHKQNTLFLTDGFINSRALQPLNSTLESFTKVCNSLIGDIWIFLDGKDRRNLGQLGPLEAQLDPAPGDFCHERARRGVSCLSPSVPHEKGPLLGYPGVKHQCRLESYCPRPPTLTLRQGLGDLSPVHDERTGRSRSCACPLLRK